MAIKEEVSLPKQGVCVRCNFVSSQAVCKACVLLEGLNKGLPRLGVGKSSKAKKMLEEYNARERQNKENVPTDNKLDLALKELNLDDTDSNKKGSCISRKGKCKTGLCSSKNATLDSKTEDVSCNNSGNTCCSSKEKTQANGEVANPKLDRLLEEYGLDDRSSSNDKQNDKDESDSEEPKLYDEEEENTCAGTCGSLQVGF